MVVKKLDAESASVVEGAAEAVVPGGACQGALAAVSHTGRPLGGPLVAVPACSLWRTGVLASCWTSGQRYHYHWNPEMKKKNYQNFSNLNPFHAEATSVHRRKMRKI